MCIVGLCYQRYRKEVDVADLQVRQNGRDGEPNIAPSSETSTLLPSNSSLPDFVVDNVRRRSSQVAIDQAFCPRNEANRRSSVEILDCTYPFETRDEMRIRNRLWKDKKEWNDVLQGSQTAAGGQFLFSDTDFDSSIHF